MENTDLAFVTAGLQVIFINFIGTTHFFSENLHLNNTWEVMDKTANSKVKKHHPETIWCVALSDPPKSNFYQ